jgi:CheY-like chemotaxis protein
MNKHEQVTILIAEDDDGHARLIQERFEAAGVSNPQIRFRDGREAWDYISRKDGGGREPGRPYLLLLDIRMPGLDGVEVLRRVKADPGLKKMPVIMLTTTDDPREIDECYRLGCNNYLTKPVDFRHFSEMIKRLGLFISVIKVSPLNGR